MKINKIHRYLIITLFVSLMPLLSTAATPEVNLIYKVNSYTPPFYKGKALNPNQGTVTVTAIPELVRASGEKVSSKNINYTWRQNDLIVQSASGLGKDTFTFGGSVPIRDNLIEVSAVSVDKSLSATKSVNIPNIFPKVLFYENNPVYGIMFNRAIVNNVNLTADEFSVLAMPYYFSTDSAINPKLDYTWNMNGRGVANQEPKNSFTTRVDTPGTGTAEIGLKVSNNVSIFQFLETSYRINFSKQ